jgi:hypothetical protein
VADSDWDAAQPEGNGADGPDMGRSRRSRALSARNKTPQRDRFCAWEASVARARATRTRSLTRIDAVLSAAPQSPASPARPLRFYSRSFESQP